MCSVFVVSCRPLLTWPLQLTGPDYDAFIGEFIEAAVDKYGKSVMLQVSDKGHTRVMSVMLQGARKDTCVGIPHVKASFFPVNPLAIYSLVSPSFLAAIVPPCS